VSTALELRGIKKSFVAGIGSCRVSAQVLRGIDLTLRVGESVVIVGPRGTGKSTLKLCAAGLLTPDAGDRIWFGDRARPTAVRRVLYHTNRGDLAREGSCGEAHLHLVDLADADGCATVERWVEQRCERGDAVLVSSRDEVAARRLGSRVLAMGSGQLHALAPRSARVAEFVDRSFHRV
jgi:ABC-type multidrug transport system ATPase subunit